MHTADKNTTEMAFVIDAMDILHGGGIDCFCIAASDGDYTMLAQRIREAGLTVLGYGEGKTPEALVASCRECRYAGKQQGVEPELLPSTPEHFIRRDMPLFEKAFETAAAGKDEAPFSQRHPHSAAVRTRASRGEVSSRSNGRPYSSTAASKSRSASSNACL